MGRDGILRHGDVIEGLVLAECFSSVPICYNRSEPIPLSLSIINQFDDVYSFRFMSPVEHVARRIQPRPTCTGTVFEAVEGPGDGSVLPVPSVFSGQKPRPPKEEESDGVV